MPSTLPVIRSASLRGYPELASALGLQPQAMLRRAGLSPRCMEDPETPISVTAVGQLLEASARAAGIDDFGLRLARERRLSNLGPISVVLREEPTARQALDTLGRYLRLLNASLLTQVEDHGELVVVREDVLLQGAASVRQSIELAIGVMFRILAELLGPTWKPRRVCFTHRPPADLSTHNALFRTALEFNAPFNGIVCHARDLAAPLPVTESGMSPLARRMLDQAMSSLRGDTTASARQLIAALLPGGRCTADQVALHLGVDRRTLHRHLRADGTHFSALMASIRREFAQRQLRDSDRSVAELAELLGFSGASAFAYWFRQQHGCTVTQWRARQANGAPADPAR